MWIFLFSIVLTVAICLSVAAFMLRDVGKASAEITDENSNDVSFALNGGREVLSKKKLLDQSLKREMPTERSPEPVLDTLLADSEVRLMMHADHVGKGELLAELNAVSLQRRKNVNAVSGFGRAVCRLQNMSEMMDRLGFDSGALAREDFNIKSVFNACQVCAADEVCHDWLARAPKALGQAPAFCANMEYFARIKQAA
jgi:Family of unknown function (DUF6455)